MKISKYNVVYISVIIIPLFFILRNINIFSNSIYSFIFKEFAYLFVFSFLFFIDIKNNNYKLKRIYLNINIFIYFLFILVGILSLILKSNFIQLYSLKYYIYDFLFYFYISIMLYKLKLIDYFFNYYIKIFILISFGALFQLLFINFNIIDITFFEKFYNIPVYKTRATFFITNPNLLALLLTICLILLNHLKKHIIFYNILIFITILLTGSRLFTLISFIIIFKRFFKYIQIKNYYRYINIFFLFFPFFIILLLNLNISHRLYNSIINYGADPRFEIWLTIIKNNFNGYEYLIGNGFGNIGSFLGVENSLNIPVYFQNKLYLNKINYIDNTFLTIFNETGLIGISLFILFLFLNLIKPFKISNKYSYTSFYSQLTIILASFFGDVLFSFPILFIYLLMINYHYYE